MPNFEVYDRKSKPVVTQPLVTLQASGTFSMNRAAYEALCSPNAVDLLYDSEERIVGFRAAEEEDPHSYPIKPQQNSLNYQTAGRAFCNYYGIEIGTARRFAAKMFDDILAIDLNDSYQIVSRNGRVGNTD